MINGYSMPVLLTSYALFPIFLLQPCRAYGAEKKINRTGIKDHGQTELAYRPARRRRSAMAEAGRADMVVAE
jgi:hypothetical protein